MSLNKCEKCGSLNVVVADSRPMEKYIRRRRKCEDCQARFTTHETRYSGEYGEDGESERRRLHSLELNFRELIKKYVGRLPAADQEKLFREIMNGWERGDV